MEETLSILTQAKNEYSSLLVTTMTPHIMEGIFSIYNEAKNICEENDEYGKYLKTFQNFLGRVTRWNSEIIQQETDRIIDKSGCSYLEDLLTCVHISQTKILTSIRVGTKQKKIETAVPSLNDFVHKVYIETARNIYKNVFLFEDEVNSLQKQKYRREIETIVQFSILSVIRNSLPVEQIIRAYLDESVEYDNEEVIEEVIEKPLPPPPSTPTSTTVTNESSEPQTKSDIEALTSVDDVLDKRNEMLKHIESKTKSLMAENETKTKSSTPISTPQPSTPQPSTPVPDKSGLSFSDVDKVKEYDTSDRSFDVKSTSEQKVEAPKSIERLEKISTERNEQRKLEEEEDSDEDEFKLNIVDSGPSISLDIEEL